MGFGDIDRHHMLLLVEMMLVVLVLVLVGLLLVGLQVLLIWLVLLVLLVLQGSWLIRLLRKRSSIVNRGRWSSNCLVGLNEGRGWS